MQFLHTPPLSIHNTSHSSITFPCRPFGPFWPLDTRCKLYRAGRPRPYEQQDKVKGQRLKRKATENLSAFTFHISAFSFIQQKRTSFRDVLFYKSGDANAGERWLRRQCEISIVCDDGSFSSPKECALALSFSSPKECL